MADKFNLFVYELRAVSVDSGITGATAIRNALRDALLDTGSKFTALVGALKSTSEFSAGNLTATKLSQAITEEVKEAIAALLKTEFQVTVDQPGTNISASLQGSGVKVLVKKTSVDRDAGNKGTATVERNRDINIPDPIEIEVQVHHELSGISGSEDERKEKAKEIAGKLVVRLAKAAVKANVSGTYNPGKDLVDVEYGDPIGATVAAAGQAVTVNAGTGSGTKSETVTIGVKDSLG